MTDKTKAKIQELCPDVMKGDVWQKQYGGTLFVDFGGKMVKVKEAPITLAVVLRAIEKGYAHPALMQYSTHVDGYFMLTSGEAENTFWNLEHDSYDQQIEECKAFLSSLLGVN